MPYWFRGFFLRSPEQDMFPELVVSIKKQWPRVICRQISEPFVGLGVRMTSFSWSAHDEEAEEQFAIEEELPLWSRQYPSLTWLYLEADCHGGACIYEGYVCRNGEILFTEESVKRGPEPLWNLLEQMDVKLDSFGYFVPFERDFFGPDQYFTLGSVDNGLSDFLRQNPLLLNDSPPAQEWVNWAATQRFLSIFNRETGEDS